MVKAGKNNILHMKNKITNKIIIRCDAGLASNIGTGHVKRILFLVKYLIKNQFTNLNSIIILHKEGPEYNLAKEILKYSKINISYTSFNQSSSTKDELHKILETGAKYVIFDTLGTKKYLISNLRKNNKII